MCEQARDTSAAGGRHGERRCCKIRAQKISKSLTRSATGGSGGARAKRPVGGRASGMVLLYVLDVPETLILKFQSFSIYFFFR